MRWRVRPGGGRHRDDDLVRPVVAQHVRQVVGRPEHADAVEAKVLRPRVVVDESRGRIAEVRVLQHLPEDQLACVAGSDSKSSARITAGSLAMFLSPG